MLQQKGSAPPARIQAYGDDQRIGGSFARDCQRRRVDETSGRAGGPQALRLDAARAHLDRHCDDRDHNRDRDPLRDDGGRGLPRRDRASDHPCTRSADWRSRVTPPAETVGGPDTRRRDGLAAGHQYRSSGAREGGTRLSAQRRGSPRQRHRRAGCPVEHRGRPRRRRDTEGGGRDFQRIRQSGDRRAERRASRLYRGLDPPARSPAGGGRRHCERKRSRRPAHHFAGLPERVRSHHVNPDRGNAPLCPDLARSLS